MNIFKKITTGLKVLLNSKRLKPSDVNFSSLKFTNKEYVERTITAILKDIPVMVLRDDLFRMVAPMGIDGVYLPLKKVIIIRTPGTNAFTSWELIMGLLVHEHTHHIQNMEGRLQLYSNKLESLSKMSDYFNNPSEVEAFAAQDRFLRIANGHEEE